jgi:hypothetical protein
MRHVPNPSAPGSRGLDFSIRGEGPGVALAIVAATPTVTIGKVRQTASSD